tara:strand:- start:165 stop:461 length:297 start_codon:yes stop_codon:yes gene_type:complete
MTRNSVKTMVKVLKDQGPMTETQLHNAAFGYDRNNNWLESNIKYAKMLRRGMKKGIIDRIEPAMKGRAKFLYFATKEIEVPCSAELDMQMANESENIQ